MGDDLRGLEDMSVPDIPEAGPVPEIDPSRPHPARIYDYGIGERTISPLTGRLPARCSPGWRSAAWSWSRPEWCSCRNGARETIARVLPPPSSPAMAASPGSPEGATSCVRSMGGVLCDVSG